MKLSNRDFLFLMQVLHDSLSVDDEVGYFIGSHKFRVRQYNDILTKQSTKDIELDEEPE